MRLTLPFPPSANVYFVPNGRGGMRTSSEARAYIERVKWIALVQRKARRFDSEALAVTVSAYRPRRIGDLDNCLKVALDAMNGVVWADDKQISELHAFRFEDAANPRLEVTVDPLPEAPHA